MLAKDPNDGSLMFKPGLIAEIADSFRNDAFSYDHRDPRMDITASFENYALGAGFEDAAPEDGSDFAYRVPIAGFRGYNFTQGVDLSRGSRGYLSNGLRPAGLALDAPAQKVVLTSLGLVAITTRYIYRWSGTSWVQVFDDGAGGHIYDIFEFTNATATYLVAATRSAAYHYSTDGITWTASEAAPAAPAFRSSASAATEGATSITSGEPASAATGDILIYTVYAISDTVTITPNVLTDWTLLATLGGSGTGTGRVYWCRRGASAPDYTINFGASVVAVAAVSAYTGGKTTGSPIESLSAITSSGGSITFTFTGADQTWVVPANATSVAITANGAGSNGAAGGLAAGTLATTPGETLHIQVGGAEAGNVGGYNSGNYGVAYGGAGASDVRQGGSALANRVVVAGGAGGTGQSLDGTGGAGAAGGAATGATGTNGVPTGFGDSAAAGGTGGTSSAGGTTGGALGVGGDGVTGAGGIGGGGGGGYYGGGGGGPGGSAVDGDGNTRFGGGGGGGGGSNYTGGLTSTTSTQGAGAAIGVNGSVTITWTGATMAPTVAAVTTLGANRMVVGVFASESDTGGVTPPGTTTERVENSSDDGSIEMYEIAAASASVYGAYTGAFANSVGYSSVGFAIVGINTTGASNVTRWAMRGQSSGAPVLWAIDNNGSIRNATLVNTPSNWSGADAIQMGQRHANQLGLEVLDNTFYLVHRGGITSYDGSTVNTVLVSPFADPPSNTARPVVAFENKLFLTFGNALLSLDPAGTSLEKVWPRGPQEGNAELNGTITAMAVNEKYVWFALKNSAGNTYLMEIDHGQTLTVGTDTIYPAHTIAYRGANDITAMAYLKADPNALSTTNPTIAVTDGSMVGFYILPKPGLRPEDDPACRFDTAADRIAVGSYVNFRAQAFPKWLTRGDIEAITTTTETVKLQYQLPAASAVDIAIADTVQSGHTTAVLAPPPSFTRARYVLLMNTSADTKTPVLNGAVLHAAPNAPRDRGFIFTVHLQDKQETNAIGVTSRWKAADLYEFLFNAVNQLVTLRDMYGTTFTTKVLDIQPVSVSYDSAGAVEAYLTVTLGQLNS